MAMRRCRRCGVGQVRCKGLCARCYFADRYEPAQQSGHPGVEGRALERAWDSHQLTVLLVNERPAPGRQMRSWATRAACRDHPDLPWTGRTATPEMRAVCAGCPVRVHCLAEALVERWLDGVWAGTTPAERRRLRP